MKHREISLIYGKTGSGKTVLAKHLLKEFNRVIIIDSMSEYENGLVFTSFDDLSSYVLDNNIYNNDSFCLICRFESDIEIEYLFKLVFEITNLLLVVEEAEIYISPFAKQSNFLRLVRYGRHKNISLLGIARRTGELSLSFRSQTDFIYSFLQTDATDLKNMELIGLNNLDQLQKYTFPGIPKENIHYKKVAF